MRRGIVARPGAHLQRSVTMLAPLVQTGLDVLARDEFAPLRGQRVGLVANAASVDGRLRHAAELFTSASQVRLTALFGPEHGFAGDTQDLTSVGDAMHPRYRCPVFSLYGDSAASLRPTDASLRGLDVLVIDLQDVGR